MAIYMHIDGIPGSVTAAGYKEWIDLDAAGFGAERTMRPGMGVGHNRETGVPTVQPYHFTKHMDDASGPLTRWALGEGGKDRVEIHHVVTAKSGPQPYLKISLLDPILASYAIAASDDPTERGVEQCAISYLAVEMEFLEYDEKGNQSNSTVVNYSIEEGRTM